MRDEKLSIDQKVVSLDVGEALVECIEQRALVEVIVVGVGVLKRRNR